jgi:type VI secretion system (T6SS) VasB/ImpH family protein
MDATLDRVKPQEELDVQPAPADEAPHGGAETIEPGAPSSEHQPSGAVMPDVSWPRYGFSHTVDSALASLVRAGIAPERITIKKAGRGWQKDRVVQQAPAAGSPLTDDVAVELTVEGDGLFSRLPTGMRDLGPDPEREPSIHELASLVDDPIAKAASYVRQGGWYFDVRPDNAPGCARWIRLFGIDPGDWPMELWYPLAVLLPRLQDLAGREAGLWLALKILLDLDVAAIGRRARRTRLSPEALSRFGERASRLGIDLIVGDGMADEAVLDITLGPVSLPIYRQHQTEEGTQRIRQVLHLLLPAHVVYAIHWLVGDAERAPRLGVGEENALLGINTHFGRT